MAAFCLLLFVYFAFFRYHSFGHTDGMGHRHEFAGSSDLTLAAVHIDSYCCISLL